MYLFIYFSSLTQLKKPGGAVASQLPSFGCSLTSTHALCKDSPGTGRGSLLSIHAGDPRQCKSTKPQGVSPGAEAG